MEVPNVKYYFSKDLHGDGLAPQPNWTRELAIKAVKV